MESRKLKFVTNNKYRGTWDEQRNCMEGFGVYETQDGIIYRGFFRNGLTHGCGVWDFGMPTNCSVVTTSRHGKIERVHGVVFADGIHISNVDKQNIDLHTWNYCNSRDRRFAEEHFRGLKAVGTETKLNLKPSEYDTVSGIYLKSSGFTIRHEFDKTATSFVPCVKEGDWIKGHCLKGLRPGEQRFPGKAVEKKILETNLRALNEQTEDDFKNISTVKHFCELNEKETVDTAVEFPVGSLESLADQMKLSSFDTLHDSVSKSDLEVCVHTTSSSLDSFPTEFEKAYPHMN